MNCWIRAGVLNARNARAISGSKPKLSYLSRRIPFLDGSLSFKVKAATFLKTPGNYTEAATSTRAAVSEQPIIAKPSFLDCFESAADSEAIEP